MARFRPFMPLSVKLDACLILLGLTPGRVQFDHDPALELRPWDDEAGDYRPAANDPRHIVPRSPEDHARKTFGRSGESKLCVLDGDVTKAAKLKRVEQSQAEFRARLLARDPGQPRERKGTIAAPKRRPAAPQRSASRPISRVQDSRP